MQWPWKQIFLFSSLVFHFSLCIIPLQFRQSSSTLCCSINAFEWSSYTHVLPLIKKTVFYLFHLSFLFQLFPSFNILEVNSLFTRCFYVMFCGVAFDFITRSKTATSVCWIWCVCAVKIVIFKCMCLFQNSVEALDFPNIRSITWPFVYEL